MKKKYSVVIPVYNSERVVATTVVKVREFFMVHALPFEIILVNDGSPDGSWDVIAKLAVEYAEVMAISLLKNYGQHNANLCGFRAATGDYVITMDDDLQNPPSEIEKLISMANEDYDLVIGRFEQKRHSLFRRAGSLVVGWINRKAFDIESGFVLTNFRMIRRDVVDRVCLDTSASPYIPGLVLKFSGNRCNVLVKHQPRTEGSSNYTTRKILRLVATILFNHSSIPLRYGAAFGFIVAILSFFLGLYYLVNALTNTGSTPGWSTLVVLISLFNGILIMLLSVIGEYLVRILREQSSGKSYVVSKIVE